MDIMMWAYYGLGIITGIGLTYAVMSYRFRKAKTAIVNDTVKRYLKILSDTTDTLNDICPKCAYNCNGKACSRLDTSNVVRYGKCTGFEEKRY